MADNTTLNTGTGGDVIATDDIGGVKHQRVKVEYGEDGSASDVSPTNALPVILTDNTSPIAISTSTADAVANTVNRLHVTNYNNAFNGTSWDRVRTIESVSAGPNVDTGILVVGVGPGYDRKRDPSNLGTGAGNTSTFVVQGADVGHVYIGTSTSGTIIFEVTADDTNWVTAPTALKAGVDTWTTTSVTPTSGDVYKIALTGWRQFRALRARR